MANYLTPSTSGAGHDRDDPGNQPRDEVRDELRDEVGDESAGRRVFLVVLHDCPACARRQLDDDCCFPVTFHRAEGGF